MGALECRGRTPLDVATAGDVITFLAEVATPARGPAQAKDPASAEPDTPEARPSDGAAAGKRVPRSVAGHGPAGELKRGRREMCDGSDGNGQHEDMAEPNGCAHKRHS